jgi:hypothetical protein
MYFGRGKVLASGRRFRDPVMEIGYTLLFYLTIGFTAYLTWFMLTHIP